MNIKASTIFCFRRYLVEANCRDFRQHDKGEMANARITASIIYRRNDSVKIYDKSRMTPSVKNHP